MKKFKQLTIFKRCKEIVNTSTFVDFTFHCLDFKCNHATFAST